MINLGTLGGSTSWGYAINDSGQVTGSSDSFNGPLHAYITDPTTHVMTDLGALGGNDYSAGLAINSYGDVVGEADIATDRSTAYLVGIIYSKGKMTDLNTLLAPADLANYRIYQAKGINDKGQIAANAVVLATNLPVAVLLIPANVAPTVQPTLTGTAGTNGWYRSSVNLSWTVTGVPAPTTTGCGAVAVTTDTKGRLFTCTATNSAGTASQSVTVKVDQAAPKVDLDSPQASTAKTYNRNQAVFAKYTCSDLMSGVASCVGSVANGARVSTAMPGTYSFVVTATDRAGNAAAKTVVYKVR
jgi:probable HAF family extracellular repeat protein